MWSNPYREGSESVPFNFVASLALPRAQLSRAGEEERERLQDRHGIQEAPYITFGRKD